MITCLNRVVVLLLAFAILAPSIGFAKGSGGSVHVKGYYRSNGTYVAPHYRSAPDGNFYNNWSTKGNVNPYTGKPGTRVTPPSSYPGDYRALYGGDLSPATPSSPPSNLPSHGSGAGSTRLSFDDESRASTANRLKRLGVDADWQKHSLSDLLDMESRASTANRLKRLGVDADWQKHSLSTLLDAESRASTANRLKRLGVDADWQKHSLSTLLDAESRASTADRLKRCGVSVDWRQYTLSQLLDMESHAWKR